MHADRVRLPSCADFFGRTRAPLRRFGCREASSPSLIFAKTTRVDRSFCMLWYGYNRTPSLGRTHGTDQATPRVSPSIFPTCLCTGCAKGSFIRSMASEQPERNYLGLEIRRPTAAVALERAAGLGTRNCHVVCCNANVSFVSLSPAAVAFHYSTSRKPDGGGSCSSFASTADDAAVRIVARSTAVERLMEDARARFLFFASGGRRSCGRVSRIDVMPSADKRLHRRPTPSGNTADRCCCLFMSVSYCSTFFSFFHYLWMLRKLKLSPNFFAINRHRLI